MNFNQSLRLVLFSGIFMMLTYASYSQRGLTPADTRQLEKKEDSLKLLSRAMVFGKNAAERFRADSNFVRILVRALKTPNSFYYPLDSVAVSKL